MVKHLSRAVALFAAAVLLAGCGVSSPSQNRQLDFAGTILPPDQNNGQLFIFNHNFTVTKNGEYEIRLTALAAGSNVPVGISLGTQAPGGGCLSLRDAIGVVGPLLMSGQMPSGQYCITVFDISPGYFAAPSTYNVRASVP